MNRPASGRIKFKQPLDRGGLAAFSQEIRGAVAARKATKGAPQAAAPSGPRVPPAGGQYPDADYGMAGDDDIPF